ncbi:MAG TPA: phosphoserine phosphatase SerB [Stellaceae bacterium]|nr:phosphoserine phosphatase SerB [Stellaceae bacterium]
MNDTVLTLIAAPTAAAEAAVAAVVAALAPLGARALGREWLAPGIACDLHFGDLDADQGEAAGRAALTQDFGAIDLIAQPVAGRRKRLLVADLESTIIANEMLDELADCVGLRTEIAEITRRAMNDEIDFAEALRERLALLKGLPESALDEAAARIHLGPGARALVTTMRAHGAYAVLVSGGFTRYTSRIRAALNFDRDIGNELIIENGRLAGTVREPILAREAKLYALKALAAERGLPLSATLAVGDGANDMAMIDAAGLGVAFHAKPALAARARHRIDHGDLTALLYAQGYRASEIVGLD